MPYAPFGDDELPPAAWGAPPVPPPPERELLINRIPGEVGLGLGLVGMELQGVGPGSAAERCGAARFIGRHLLYVNDQPVRLVSEVMSAAGDEGPALLVFESKDERVERLRMERAEAELRRLEGDPQEQDHYENAGEREYVVIRQDPRLPLGLDLRHPGLTLEGVRQGGPAEAAGLASCVGLAVTHVDGHPVRSTADFAARTHGRGRVTLRLAEEVAGCVLRRGAPGVPLGFSVFGTHLEVTRVDPGTPAEHAGMGGYVGWSLTHVDGAPVSSAADVAAASRRKLRVYLRFGPVPDDDDVAASAPGAQEIEMEPRGGGLGMQLREVPATVGEPGALVLHGVTAGSPAEEAGLGKCIGHHLTHIDREPVSTSQDVAVLVQGRHRIRLRFEPSAPPDGSGTKANDVTLYRAWLARRQQTRDQALRPGRDARGPAQWRARETGVVIGPLQPPHVANVTGAAWAYPADNAGKF